MVQAVLDHLVMKTAKEPSTTNSTSAFAAHAAPASNSAPSGNKVIGLKAGGLCNLEAHAGLTHTNCNCNMQNNMKQQAKAAAIVAAHAAKAHPPAPLVSLASLAFAAAVQDNFNPVSFAAQAYVVTMNAQGTISNTF
ncbi:hypothetical protein CROQUDRAFT_136139 [Cronartium quercuum f. sp. fusiforme G11]|uniref:Uncharacterized protein n=1 Tax=Cronartium quercuum f. sp. fusiforme G11 TaxID=708437 RepID=A0A9P6N7R8_9BASI|nr:hypothetical protein CROQUDRAFT_136139 [Cronartium quercuum f. sp. fusiforme G11]